MQICELWDIKKRKVFIKHIYLKGIKDRDWRVNTEGRALALQMGNSGSYTSIPYCPQVPSGVLSE